MRGLVCLNAAEFVYPDEMTGNHDGTRCAFWLEGTVLGVLCAVYVGWVLSLPAFTTQDGPMHLYFAHVMLALFSKAPGVYGRFYTIKHLLPPYSAYYYLLIGLSRLVPLLMADKLVICGYMVSFVYGFRYLARAVGPAAEQASLLATMLVLNWPLGMGFVNYCLGVSLALWTLGVWMRAVGQPDISRRILFVVMCLGLVLVHPVPLLAVLGYCGVDLLARFLGKGRFGRVTKADAVSFLFALPTLGYIKLFTIAHPARQTATIQTPFLRQVLENCHMYLRGRGLVFFDQLFHHAALPKQLYGLLLTVILPGSVLLGIWQAARDRKAHKRNAGWLWLTLTLVLLFALPFIPDDMNASHHFAERLLVLLGVGSLLTMSTFVRIGTAGRVAVALMAVTGATVTLWTADPAMRSVANEMAGVERSPIAHEGELGIALGDPHMVEEKRLGLAFDPYRWAAVNYIRHNDAVLYGTPWLDLTVIPLGARQGLATGTLSPNAIEDWVLLRNALIDNPDERRRAVANARFAAVNHIGQPAMSGPDPLLPGWTCREQQDWLAVCVP